MKTTINLDDDVYEAARERAKTTGETLGRVLSKLARPALLARSVSAPSRSQGVPSRFPVFEVPADAPMIPASRIQSALDEDGI